jgi:hypothetical protein
MRFSVSHLKSSKFARRGLRSYFEYRDLGIQRATRGKVVAHVIRARPGKAPHGEWHAHDCKVQFVHRELKHSTNLEMIEIVSPARFRTYSAEKPAARRSPARR